VQRPHPDRRQRAGVGERAVDQRVRLAVDAAHEDDRDPLPLEPAPHHERVRLVHELERGPLPLLERADRRARPRELILELRDALFLERLLALGDRPGDADPDQDPDQERQEDGGKRRDVVAEVEH
jgi:hypothetical protein